MANTGIIVSRQGGGGLRSVEFVGLPDVELPAEAKSNKGRKRLVSDVLGIFRQRKKLAENRRSFDRIGSIRRVINVELVAQIR